MPAMPRAPFRLNYVDRNNLGMWGYPAIISAFIATIPAEANFAWADGHVSFIINEIDFAIFRGLSTRGEREVITTYPQ